MPTLTAAHLKRLKKDQEIEVKIVKMTNPKAQEAYGKLITKKTELLENDNSYGIILEGITKAYEEEGISLPEDPLDIVVGIVSDNILPTDYTNLKTYYYAKTKYGTLSGGGRKRRKSKKRKSKKRRTKKRKSKKRKSRTRRRRR